LVGAPCAGAIQSQADQPAVLEGFVAFGLVQDGSQRQARGFRVHALGAVGQSIIPERAAQTQLSTNGRVG